MTLKGAGEGHGPVSTAVWEDPVGFLKNLTR
jgi:hypothetical protein